MKFGRLGKLQNGYNSMTTSDSKMLMDIGYQIMGPKEILSFIDTIKETAFVILTGQISITWDEKTETMERRTLFDENPYC